MEHSEVIRDRATALEMLCGVTPAGTAQPRGRGAQVRASESLDSRQSSMGRQQCRCGTCKVCVSNARWERIYNEKFADAGYYGGLRFRNSSPLAGF